MSFISVCQSRWGSLIKRNEPLARHGTFAVGGPAEVWFGAKSEEDLLTIVQLAHQYSAYLMFVGNGTNVLYAQSGAQGAVVRPSLETWELIDIDDSAGTAILIAGSGVSLPKLVNELAALGWAGMEWGAGVPGTIGGAVVSNAGCHGQCIGDNILKARVLDAHDPANPGIREILVTELGLSYRHSRFRANRHVQFDKNGQIKVPAREMIDPLEVITGASFLLYRVDPSVLYDRIVFYKQHRKDTQPSQPSAGSVFKNPPEDYAGRLIETVGLKGHVIGRAAISEKHANFIVNQGGATVADIVGLITLAHKAVYEECGISLELEVEPRGDWNMG
jgi:UDP-N-acetylmuramate dehydrogenase